MPTYFSKEKRTPVQARALNHQPVFSATRHTGLSIQDHRPEAAHAKTLQLMMANSPRTTSVQMARSAAPNIPGDKPIQLLRFQGGSQLDGEITSAQSTNDSKSVIAENIKGKPLGSGANGPSGFDLGNYGELQRSYDFTGAYVLTRMHLLNGQLGGAGNDSGNLAWGTANFNNPVMYHAVEKDAQDYVQAGGTIQSYSAAVSFDYRRPDTDPLRWWPTRWDVKWYKSDGSKGGSFHQTDVLPTSKWDAKDFRPGMDEQEQSDIPIEYYTGQDRAVEIMNGPRTRTPSAKVRYNQTGGKGGAIRKKPGRINNSSYT